MVWSRLTTSHQHPSLTLLFKSVLGNLLQTIRTPRRAISKLLLFLGFAFLFYVSGTGGLYRRLQSSTDDFKFIAVRKSAAEFIWPNIREDMGDHGGRELKWKNEVVKSLSEPKKKRFPDVFIVGAERCGGEAVANLLLLHPLIKPTNPLESHFFTKYFSEGSDYYMNMMPNVTDRELILEATQTYFTLPPSVLPRRIKKLSPDAKIVVVLCNPADRVMIDFNIEMLNRQKYQGQKYTLYLGTYLNRAKKMMDDIPYDFDAQMQTKIFASIQKDFPSHVTLSGLYYYHAIRWKLVFRPAQLLYLNRRDVLKNTGDVMLQLQKFLRIPALIHKDNFLYDDKSKSFCYHSSWDNGHNAQKKHCPISEEANVDTFQPMSCYRTLHDFYRPHNEKLYQLLKRNFTW